MRVLLFLILMFGLNICANAQENKALLAGSVYDANGALITRAKITAINQKLEKFETYSNGEGEYKLSLPFKPFDSTKSANFRIEKYVLIVKADGFEQFVMKGLNFVPSTYGKMTLDFALDIDNSNCGAGGCIPEPDLIKPNSAKLSNEFILKPLEKLPKAQNKIKGK